MAQTFEDLGLGEKLIEAATAAGYDTPTPLQRAAVPVLRRGGNAVLHASPGAGVVGAYGLALLDRLRPEGAADEERGDAAGVRALVVVPTSHGAVTTAESLGRIAHPVGARVTALAPGWPGPDQGADIVVGSPSASVRALQGAVLKVDQLQTLVVDGVSVIFSLDEQAALDTLVAATPRDAQRIMISAEFGTQVEGFLEGRVRRALRIPSRAADAGAPPQTVGRCQYVVATEADKLATVAELVANRDGRQPALIFGRTAAGAGDVGAELALRGLRPGSAESPQGADVVTTAEDYPDADQSFAPIISYDVPFDGERLAARHASGGLVLVTPRELPHLRRIASATGIDIEVLSLEREDQLREEAESFRDLIRSAAREEDLGAPFQLLEPLLKELSATEIAAAAIALLRRRVPPQAPPPATAPTTAPPASWTRLFISIGERDGIRPGDLVGAITGEASIGGDQVGRIEIRDTFSVVEVASGAAARVIDAMNGITLKGRSLRVDYDRKPPSGGRRGPSR